MNNSTFVIYGASDDLIETSGVPGCDEFPTTPEDKGAGFAGSFILSGKEGAMRIMAFYGPGCCWGFLPMQVDEYVPFPDWPITIRTGEPARGYSTVLEIDVPPSTFLTKEERI